MLTIYRRHQKRCKHRGKGRKYRECSCPIWAQGTLGGKTLRRSITVRGWQNAQEIVRQWEADGRIEAATSSSMIGSLSARLAISTLRTSMRDA